jgi:chloramphenicol 3-O phosphotransferase
VVSWPDVIVVNGPSSAGKSTLCRGVQAALESQPYLVTGFDDFVFMSAPRLYRGADTAHQTALDAFTEAGVRMVPTHVADEPTSVDAVFGPVFRRLIDGMAPAVRALVDAGSPVIFDHVLHDQEMYDGMVRAFAGLDVMRVGVECPIEILEQREAARGDRVLGRARGLSRVVHTFCDYDVRVDTGRESPEACVNRVVEALRRR